MESIQSRFVLGPGLASNSAHLTGFADGPAKSRWSSSFKHTRNTESTKPQFSRIRNRSYMLSVSPQKQPLPTRLRIQKQSLVTRSRRSKQAIDYGDSQDGKLEDSLSSSPKTRERSPLRPRARKAKSIVRKKTSDADDTSTAKPSLKVLSIPSREKAKWTSIPEQAKSLLLESMSYSSSLIKMRGKFFEDLFEEVNSQVRNRFVAATAPSTGKQVSYSNLRSKLEILKDNSLNVVRLNRDLAEKLEVLGSQAKDQFSKVENINDVISTKGAVTEGPLSLTKDWTAENEDVFCDYLTDLVASNRQKQ